MIRTLSRLASAVGVSLPAAAIASFPAALRSSASAAGEGSVGLPAAWLALAGALVLPMTAAVLVLRGARQGIAVVAGEAEGATPDAVDDAAMEPSPLGIPDPSGVPEEHVPARASLLLAALVGWGAVVCAGLAPLGALLRARTHHHGLAGVAFAGLGLLYALVAALAMRRVVELLGVASAQTRRIFLGAFWIGLGLAVLVLGALGGARSAGGGASAPALGTSALVVDLLAFLLAAGFAARPLGAGGARVAERGFVLASALAVLVAIAGVGSLARSPVLALELARTSSFLALITPIESAPADGSHDAESRPDDARPAAAD